MSVTDKTAKAVLKRDGGDPCCVVCGTNQNITIQHRMNRGMGGSKLLDGPENLIMMCWTHNSLLETDAKFAQLGRANGWKLHKNRTRSANTVPVWFPKDRAWYYLLANGTKVVARDWGTE